MAEGSALQQEIERRVSELPRLRPADQIDISESMLQMIREIFDSEKDRKSVV